MSTSMVITRSSIKEFKRVHNNYKAISIIASRFSPNGFIRTFKNGKTNTKNISYYFYFNLQQKKYLVKVLRPKLCLAIVGWVTWVKPHLTRWSHFVEKCIYIYIYNTENCLGLRIWVGLLGHTQFVCLDLALSSAQHKF